MVQEVNGGETLFQFFTSKLDCIYLLPGTLSCLVQINSDGIKYIARLQ